MLRQLPNVITTLRLLLALPLGWLILTQDYSLALATGVIAGASDALDGYLARRLDAFTTYGAAADPAADKLMIFVTFVCMAQVGIIPWYLALLVIGRDLVILTGAGLYYWLIGPFQLGATMLSKLNMCVQVIFCVLVLGNQVIPVLPPMALTLAGAVVILVAVLSGADYVNTWSRRAIEQGRKQ